MASGKIEPRLAEEIERLGPASGDPIPVLVQHPPPDAVPSEADLADLERAAQDQQGALVTLLEAVGASGPIEPLVLADAVATELTPAQITAIAESAVVTGIRLNRAEQVTT